MLTARGWWLFVVALVLTAIGMFRAGKLPAAVPLLGLSLLVWLVAHWIVFAVRYRDVVSSIRITRSLWQGGRPVSSAWSKSACRVRVDIDTTGQYTAALVFATDRAPDELPEECSGPLGPDAPLRIEYALKPITAGVLRFEGVALRFTDLTGLFYRRTFIRDRIEFLVLPPLLTDDSHRRTDKRSNTLPPPGLHRLRRPGGAGDLLDRRPTKNHRLESLRPPRSTHHQRVRNGCADSCTAVRR
jgi:uncharacterized protein (DUF58 family)